MQAGYLPALLILAFFSHGVTAQTTSPAATTCRLHRWARRLASCKARGREIVPSHSERGL